MKITLEGTQEEIVAAVQALVASEIVTAVDGETLQRLAAAVPPKPAVWTEKEGGSDGNE